MVIIPEDLILGDHEKLTAHRLALHGADVEMLLPSRVKGVRNPDALVNGEVWEFKAPKGASPKNTISDQFRRGGKQCDHLVIDLARCALSEHVAIAQCEERFHHQRRIRRLIVLDVEGKVAFYGVKP
ncbi:MULTISPECIES: CdiA C-terminal domain-containing protein [unclassified Luteococcus]|uniref:CdiA C-terminal domain-containing protein n=1 Tax=unclassified Luteococcus TaxID=2639923 RepID=UPI00313E8132